MNLAIGDLTIQPKAKPLYLLQRASFTPQFHVNKHEGTAS